MGNLWIATQLVAGNEGRTATSREGIVRAIARAREAARIDALILWPSAEPGLTGELARACRSLGIRPLLWFPVLSDAPGVPQRTESLVKNCTGSRGQGTAGAWEGLVGGEERFLFSCPNDTRSLDAVFDACSSLLAGADVDGVMLDKIRFPSPSNGFEALLGCFCDSCRTLFESRTGRPLEPLRQKGRELLEQLHGEGPAALLAAWKHTGSFWKAVGLEELAGFRVQSILSVVERFSSLARSRGLEVGLDLFSPSLAPLVSQDYEALSSLCDWVKPMIYRSAVGPAGLPLEVASLWKAFVGMHPRSDPMRLGRSLREIFGWETPDTGTELLRRGLPAAVISSELEAIARMRLAAGVKVYAGIEAVRIPRFGIDVASDALERSLREVRPPAGGIIASWNLLNIPDDNLRLLGSWKR
jgi:hypothetical protein